MTWAEMRVGTESVEIRLEPIAVCVKAHRMQIHRPRSCGGQLESCRPPIRLDRVAQAGERPERRGLIVCVDRKVQVAMFPGLLAASASTPPPPATHTRHRASSSDASTSRTASAITTSDCGAYRRDDASARRLRLTRRGSSLDSSVAARALLVRADELFRSWPQRGSRPAEPVPDGSVCGPPPRTVSSADGAVC